MSLLRKLTLFLFAAVALPLVGVALVLVRTSEDALRDRIRAAQTEAVEAQAQAVAAFVTERVDALRRAAGYFELSAATGAELEGAVRVLYKASGDVAVAGLVDGAGRSLAPPVFLDGPAADPDLAAHPRSDAAAARRALAFAPADRALAEGLGAVVLSPAYAVPERGETAFAVAMPVPHGEDGAVFVAEISLGALQRRAREAEAAGRLFVVDGEGRAVAHPDAARLRETLRSPEVARALERREAGAVREAGPEGPVLAAFAPVPVPGLGWRVVASLPEREAFAPVRRMRWTVLGALALALLLLLGGGGAFVGRVRRGLDRVTAGAEAYGRGDLDHRIEPPSEAELAALARTFNAMGEELGAARTRLEGWNDELRREVEARTRELEEAQARLLQAQKLAAVGQLGAGVAHEINNPLAGLLGNVQLLRLQRVKRGVAETDPEMETLARMEEAALRCKNVTTGLLRFSQPGAARRDPVDVGALLGQVDALARGQVEAQGAALEVACDEPAPVILGDEAQLTQALLHLVANARTALQGKAGGRVRLTGRRVDGEAELVVSDDGKGIDPEVRDRVFEPFFTTKDVWTNVGLGLSVTYRLVEEHGGRIALDSQVGEGTTVTIRLPLAAAAEA